MPQDDGEDTAPGNDLRRSAFYSIAREIVGVVGGEDKRRDMDRAAARHIPDDIDPDRFEEMMRLAVGEGRAIQGQFHYDRTELARGGVPVTFVKAETGAARAVIDAPTAEVTADVDGDTLYIETPDGSDTFALGFLAERVEVLDTDNDTMTTVELVPLNPIEAPEREVEPEPEPEPEPDADVDCVYCGSGIEETPMKHHAKAHPDKQYDPIWYRDEPTPADRLPEFEDLDESADESDEDAEDDDADDPEGDGSSDDPESDSDDFEASDGNGE